MTVQDLVIIGGGEHARVIAETLRGLPDAWRLVGYTDPDPTASAGALAGVTWLGDDATYAARRDGDPAHARPALILGFRGAAADRDRVAATFDGAEWAVVIHPRAWVATSATLDPGVVVLAGAIVNAGATVGAHGLINSAAIVEHDVIVGPGTHVAPGAVIGGGTRIGADATIGLGAVIRDHVSIGDRAVVGMGAVVVDDVPADTTVVGVPARPWTAG